MVSARGPPPAASQTAVKKSLGVRGAKKASIQKDTASLSKVSEARIPTNSAPAVGPRLRKRLRDGPLGKDEAHLSSALSLGEQSQKAKRTKTQSSPAGAVRSTREKARTAAKSTLYAANSTESDVVTVSVQSDGGSTKPTILDLNQAPGNAYAAQGYSESLTADPEGLLLQGLQLKTQSLPVLDNFATQILSIIANSSYEKIIALATNPGTDAGQAYSTLMTLFNHTKKLYATDDPFLSSQKLGLVDEVHVRTIKKANMATILCSLFGGQDLGFNDLNESFLHVFPLDDTKLVQVHAQLLLDLKTQAYISAVTSDKAAIITGQHSREGFLDDLLPLEIEKNILDRRNGASQLTPTEQKFVERALSRRSDLLKESGTDEAIDALPEKHSWEQFLKDIRSYVHATFEDITGTATSRPARPGRPLVVPRSGRKQQQQQQQQQRGLETSLGRQRRHSGGLASSSNARKVSAVDTSNDIAEKAARAAHFAMEDYGENLERRLPPQPQPPVPDHAQTPSVKHQAESQSTPAPGPPIQFHFEYKLHPNVPSPPPPFFNQAPYQSSGMQGQWHPGSSGSGQFHHPYDDHGMIPFPTQSAPTHVLYERARMAASTKSSQQQTPRKLPTNTPTQRRPWTSDEENALMAGLDRVKGPHWSQIHAMFGPGGTINEVLKDRTQVQLKDKARNLKLFFLKSNIEVPYYLQFVTGELKTRAPSRVAKIEAREKGMSDEDRAHVQGVMALAGTANAIQDGDQVGLGLEDAPGVPDSIVAGQAQSLPNDINIDPSLDATLQMQNAVTSHANPALQSRYTVPTPNMIMQTLEKFSTQDGTQQMQGDQQQQQGFGGLAQGYVNGGTG